MNVRYPKMILFAVSAIILILYIIAPLINTNGRIVDLDGTMGYIDNSSLWSKLDPISSAIYTFGDFICHQQMSRTFILNGNQMPVCVRDVGIMAGFAIGMLIMLVRKEYDRKRTIFISAIGMVLMGIDWAVQNIFSLNVPVTRVITGLTMGIAIAFILTMILDGRLTEPKA